MFTTYNVLKTGVKNKIVIPSFRQFYELYKNIRFTIWKTFFWEKKANFYNAFIDFIEFIVLFRERKFCQCEVILQRRRHRL